MAIALGSLLAGAIYTWFIGEDVNWDWQNYHEYNVWAVINGRYGLDALPAGFQTYFNPAVYFPVYYLRHLLPLPYGLMIMGAVHGLNLLLIYFLVRVLLREAATASAIGASILIAAVGPMTLSEVGTSFSDILTALPILAGCILILSADGSHHGRYVLAGLLIGAAVGLKLTNVVYALGAAAAVLAASRPLMATLCLGRWRRGRRAGDRRRMGADALARDGQSDFPALQRRVPVPGIGPDEHHGLAIPAARHAWTRWPIPSIGWSATTGARNIRSATRGLRSRRC